MSHERRLRALEASLAAAKEEKIPAEEMVARQIIELCHLPEGHPDEAKAKEAAAMIVAAIMAQENPATPHYPTVIAHALADRYNIDLLKYAVNEKHAEVIRRSLA
jgi:hypothetical protein